MQNVKTRQQVAALLALGLSQNEIARRLGKTKSTIAYHARTAGKPVDERCTRRYDWSEIQRYYDEGHSITECQAKFGFARETWNQARRRGDVVSRRIGLDLEALLVAGVRRNRANLKRRLIAAGVKSARCEGCGLTQWRGRPISLEVHHVNGDGSDNTLLNIELLCGNCHAQTDNWGGKNKRLKNGAAASTSDA